MMKFLKIAYNSFLWAMTIAILSFKSEWLQMRVNTGYIFFGLMVFLTIIFSLIFRNKKTVFSWIFTAGNLVVCSAIGVVLYGFDRLKVVPAALVREGIHRTRIPFSNINFVLSFIILAGMICIIACDTLFKKTKQMQRK